MAQLSQSNVQDVILAFIRAKHPEPQTHHAVAAALPWFEVNAHAGSNTVHLVSVNMDRMAKDGVLWIDPATLHKTKHYGL